MTAKANPTSASSSTSSVSGSDMLTAHQRLALTSAGVSIEPLPLDLYRASHQGAVVVFHIDQDGRMHTMCAAPERAGTLMDALAGVGLGR